MNVRNRRGIDNLLLRRVRRHQAMTALFRAPGTDSEQPRAAQARPVVQKQEQDTPVEAPVAEATPSLPVIPVRSDIVARKAVTPSTPKPLSPLPLLPLPLLQVNPRRLRTPPGSACKRFSANMRSTAIRMRLIRQIWKPAQQRQFNRGA